MPMVVDDGLAVTVNIDEEPIEHHFSFLPDNSDSFSQTSRYLQ